MSHLPNGPTQPRRSLRSLPLGVYVFSIVFVLRLLVLVQLADSPFLLPAQGDMHFYNDWARRISGGEWTDHRAFYGLPGYAYLLAALYAAFGFNPFVPGLLQVCLEAGTALILFALGRRVFDAPDTGAQAAPPASGPGATRGTTIGGLAAMGWAFYLPAQSYSVILMPTVWLVFIFWLLVWEMVRRPAMPSTWWFILVGLLVGITAVGIATILFLVPLILLAVVLKWSSGRPSARWRAITAAAILLTSVGVGTSPAWLHNWLVARDPVFLSAHSGVNLWIGNNPEANGYPRFPLGLRGGQQAMLKDSIRGAEAAAGRPLQHSEVSDYWSAKAKAYMRENPAAWLKLLARKVANFWNSFQYDDISVITSMREHGVTLPGLRFGIVAALALTGIAFALLRFRESRWVFAAILLHMTSLLGVFITERYRLAAVPGLLLFAGFAVVQLWELVVASQYSRAAAMTGVLTLAAIVVSIPRADPSLWALDFYNSGLQAFESKRLEVAERKLQLAYAYVPHNAELLFALGNLHLARGERDAAKSYYGRTLALDPRHEGSFNNLGIVAMDEKEWSVAAEMFRRALEQEPNDAKTLYLLAQAHYEGGSVSEALAILNQALRLAPSQPEFIALHEKLTAPSPSPAPPQNH